MLLFKATVQKSAVTKKTLGNAVVGIGQAKGGEVIRCDIIA